jgi:hypothetical protein
MWPQLVPLVEESIQGNDVSANDLSAQDIFNAICTDEIAIFAGFEGGDVVTILGIQFHGDEQTKIATIVVMAGRKLLMFKRHYWKPVLDWLQGNGVAFLDSHVPLDRVMLYTTKFGFNQSCAYIRMTLG